MNVRMLLRALVWLVILGVMTAGLTVCNVSGPTQVAHLPSRAPSESRPVAVVPSPTPVPAADTPVPTELTGEATEEPTATPTEEVTEEPTPEPTEEATQEPAEEPTVEPAEEVTEELIVEPTEEATEEATEEPTPIPDVDVAALSSENCVNCHTNQETLQALAEDKVVQSEATSGEG